MTRDNAIMVSRSLGYKHMLFYKKAVIIYDLTSLFCSRYINIKDRTYDQMIQAARSGKQNIVEGYVDGATSYKSCLQLLNIARGSLMELLEDYDDYLRTRELREWERNSVEVETMIKLSKEHNDSDFFLKLAETRNDEVIANMVITLIRIDERLLYNYIQRKSREFIKDGGFSERLTRERLKERHKR